MNSLLRCAGFLPGISASRPVGQSGRRSFLTGVLIGALLVAGLPGWGGLVPAAYAEGDGGSGNLNPAPTPAPFPSPPVVWHVLNLTVEQAQQYQKEGLTSYERFALLQEFASNQEPTDAKGGMAAMEQSFANGTPVPAPTSPQGVPLPPPVGHPPGPNGQPNPWRSIPGTPNRPLKWIPTFPVPSDKGGQPGGSWDEEGHWDIDDGQGNRSRYGPDGTPVDHKYIITTFTPPSVYYSINSDTALLLTAMTLVVVLVVVIIVFFPPAAPAAPLLFAAAVPAN